MGAGTDATRVASYNPWVCLYWLVTGNTLGGTRLYDENRLDRATALRLWTADTAWFANDVGRRGAIKEGMLADFIVPSADYFAVPEEDIRFLSSSLTVVGGAVVHGDGLFKSYAPAMPKTSPDWSPTNEYPGYHIAKTIENAFELGKRAAGSPGCGCGCGQSHSRSAVPAWLEAIHKGDERFFWGSPGCSCWM